MTERWRPTEADEVNGHEGYLKYVGGLVLLHDPNSDISQGIIGEGWQTDETQALGVIEHAKGMMYDGLRRIIAAANPPDTRTPLAAAENNYDGAVPVIRQYVTSVYDTEADRLAGINPALPTSRPMPLYGEDGRALYKMVCHGRRGLIRLSSLMDGFMIAQPLSRLVVAEPAIVGPRRPGQRQPA